MTAVELVVETGSRRCFASALDWPGWSRSARDEGSAIDALLDYRDRYARAIGAAARPPRRPDVRAVERLAGSAGTDFGAPMAVAQAEQAATTAAQGRRLAAILAAAWSYLDEVVANAPPVLRKGPRGGGRDRDAIDAHVRAAEVDYARKLDIPRDAPDIRAAILAVLSAPNPGRPVKDKAWPVRYAARRITWHVLDHAWEIEDKSDQP